MAEQPVSNTQAAVDFLQQHRPSGPWVLSAITVGKKGIETRSFDWGDLRKMYDWVESRQGKKNIYFSINPTIEMVSKKAEREDILEMSHLHVDLDAREGEDLGPELERMLAQLTTKRQEVIPEPTAVWYSGGGYWATWKLKEPVQIEGKVEIYEDAKLYNLWLETLFSADHCHNIDRIARLPGTINIPDAKKKKKGRVVAVSELVWFKKDNVYDLEEFQKAPAIQSAVDTGFTPPIEEITIPGDARQVGDINELDEWDVPDRVKVVIVQGRHPDEPKEGDNSRSAWLFDAVCNLVRHEVPDEIIYSIIMDKGWAISESVLENGRNAHKYALKQINSAKEFVIDPILKFLNERHAVISNIGGRCRIIEEIMDPSLHRTRLTISSFEDFRNAYMNKKVKIATDKTGKPIYMPAGKWWLEHAKRRQYHSIVFAPGQDIPEVYNMWKGFGVESIPGECGKFLSHIEKNVCENNPVYFDYLMRWMARCVQYPGTPGEVAIVLRGGRGVGKSFFAKHFGKMFGRHFLQISNPSHLVGNFNAHLRDVVVLFADEAFYAGDKKHASILKTLITEETITIEAKGVDAEASSNNVHLIMASNDQHVVPAGGDERRFFVLDVSKEHQQDTAYFGAIVEEMEKGGYEALLHLMMTFPLDKFDVRSVPQTDALKEQKLLSLGDMEEWWYNKLDGGEIIEGKGWAAEILRDTLADDYIDYCQRFKMMSRRGNMTALGRFLSRVCPGLKRVTHAADIQMDAGNGFTKSVRHPRARFYLLPTLEKAREAWEQDNGKIDWPDYEPQKDIESKVPF